MEFKVLKEGSNKRKWDVTFEVNGGEYHSTVFIEADTLEYLRDETEICYSVLADGVKITFDERIVG